MTQLPSYLPEILLTRGLPAALAVVDEARKALRRHMLAHPGNSVGVLNAARQILARHEPLLARVLRDSMLLAWLSAAEEQTAGIVAPGLAPQLPDGRAVRFASKVGEGRALLWLDPLRLADTGAPEHPDEAKTWLAAQKAVRPLSLQLDAEGAPLIRDPEAFSRLRQAGVDRVAVSVPRTQAKAFREQFGAAGSYRRSLGEAPPSGPPAPPLRLLTGDEGKPLVRFPQIEVAAKSLQEKRIVSAADFARLDQDARRTAFTVAKIQSEEALGRLRDALQEDVSHGGTLRNFREVADKVTDRALSPWEVETVYRNQIGQAYSSGLRSVMEHPAVADQFPYALWAAIGDSRVRPDHWAMMTHGQNGTAVYRSDDPIFETLFPPAAWACRCHVIFLSIADAARHGSREAQQWLRTGVPPENPVYAARPYPITPPPGWPRHDRIASVL